MPESWQIKKYYDPRVLIGVADLFDCPLPDLNLICLTGPELLMLRNVVAYCHRRSTFVVTYGKDYYVAPDNPTWDAIDALVAGLEEKLMADCTDLLDRLDLMIAEMTTQNATLATLSESIEGIESNLSGLDAWAEGQLELLECICSKVAALQQNPAIAAQIDGFLADASLQIDDDYGLEETPGEDTDACAVAQLTWHFMYETMTEIVHPAQDKAVGILTPIAIAVIASWIGTPFLGIPVGALMLLLWAISDTWVAGRFDVVTNAIFTNKDEIICAAYQVLRESGNLEAAAAAIGDVVSDIPELSPLDKVCIRSLGVSWVISRMGVAWQNETPWALQRVSAGYCAANCPEDYIVGSDWIAMPYPETPDVVEISHPSGGYWEYGCWAHNVPDGFDTAGVFFEVLTNDGTCGLKRMNGVSAGCGHPATLWDNTGDSLTPGWYFSYKTFEFNNAECLASVHPGATQLSTGHVLTQGPADTSSAFGFGWSCEGTATIRIHYIVYKGTTPPW